MTCNLLDAVTLFHFAMHARHVPPPPRRSGVLSAGEGTSCEPVFVTASHTTFHRFFFPHEYRSFILEQQTGQARPAGPNIITIHE
jgi:hypothetical protein